MFTPKRKKRRNSLIYIAFYTFKVVPHGLEPWTP